MGTLLVRVCGAEAGRAAATCSTLLTFPDGRFGIDPEEPKRLARYVGLHERSSHRLLFITLVSPFPRDVAHTEIVMLKSGEVASPFEG